MRPYLSAALLVCALAGWGSAQTPETPSCPKLSLSGPSGIIEPGDIARFTVTVDTKGKQYELKYVWSVTAGKILSGQGTSFLDVRMPETQSVNVTVTVDVKGLPELCPSQISEAQPCDLRPPVAVKLDEFRGSLAKVALEKFSKIVETASADPTAQIYIFISGTERNRGTSIRAKRARLVKEIVSKFHDPLRVTYVDSAKNDDRVEIWLVPPGAANPSVQ